LLVAIVLHDVALLVLVVAVAVFVAAFDVRSPISPKIR
jgi:hypothetical protein